MPLSKKNGSLVLSGNFQQILLLKGMKNINEINPLQYPIGQFEKKENYTNDELKALIRTLENAPENYRKIIERLKPDDLCKTYREGSWNIQQLMHHVADIHLLHFFRMKKALTEPDYDKVTIIDMDEWAKTPEGLNAPVEDSLMMFEGINRRYVFLLHTLDDTALKVQYFHPVRKYWINQAQAIAMSAWHVSHHLAHIKLALGAP